MELVWLDESSKDLIDFAAVCAEPGHRPILVGTGLAQDGLYSGFLLLGAGPGFHDSFASLSPIVTQSLMERFCGMWANNTG